MILNTTERKERTEDEVSDAADLDCLYLHAERHFCQRQINNRLKTLCTCVHAHTYIYTFIILKDGWITAGAYWAQAPDSDRAPKQKWK